LINSNIIIANRDNITLFNIIESITHIYGKKIKDVTILPKKEPTVEKNNNFHIVSAFLLFSISSDIRGIV
jgi:hypothetical protein